jgi:NAD-dependent deacetylase
MEANRPDEVIAAIKKAATLIRGAKHGVAFTGAGLSTPSGIPDFRSAEKGLWTRVDPTQTATLSAFRYDQASFFKWLRMIAEPIAAAKPNPAHIGLAKLEEHGYIQTIVTQNVDGLHQSAGARSVLEVHGTFHSFTCTRCFKKYRSFFEGPAGGISYVKAYLEENAIPRCIQCGGILKPDIILFEEQLPQIVWQTAQKACRIADVFIVAGSSLEVMPAAGLPMRALENFASLILINRTPTYLDVRADVIIREDVAEVIPQITKAVLNGRAD